MSSPNYIAEVVEILSVHPKLTPDLISFYAKTLPYEDSFTKLRRIKMAVSRASVKKLITPVNKPNKPYKWVVAKIF